MSVPTAILSAPPTDVPEPVLAEAAASLFASLPRVDQRRTALAYLRGLLSVDGRKSITNLAAGLGPGADQSLQHFVANSPWHWSPVRRALTRWLAERLPPRAWVLRPLVVPRSGRSFAGVERHVLPETGAVVNAQRAVGVWSADEGAAVPVHFRMQLSAAWLGDGGRRRRAQVPDGLAAESSAACAVAAARTVSGRRGPARPVVADGRGGDGAALAGRLQAAGIPSVVRIDPLTPLEPLAAGPARAQPAHRLVRGRGEGGVAAARVRLPPVPGAQGARSVLLVAVGGARGGRPDELWTADLPGGAPAARVREAVRLRLLASLAEREEERAERLGVRDFSGRSFTGWHRHATLVCAAHAVQALAGADAARRVPA
ncbi:IS701 family transposase [Nocardiopsis suaedae]|uniref:Transposase n=1 Tax=Nocardiopsis suaedae TaxID=3018444 RepID=A0ABT4TP77_9ACTN|nr:transposase [Nocardiopsis suaedae]MDA2806195.1 transposase [Nocardiopsis suaedae]